ncbi:MAG: hypothetical protein ACRBK7_17570, partial [Acidimicrobiales bacterium]
QVMSIDPLSPSQEASDDWPSKASATIVQYVGTVRDKTTGPALVASRYAVYVLAMVLIAMVLAVLLLVLLVRVLVTATAALPFVDDGETWLAYYIIGAIFVLGGAILWRKKEP